MRPFRFRAAAALDLRRKEEDSARLRFAKAQTDLQHAQQRVADADNAAFRATVDLTTAQSGGTEAWRISWHQSWIRRQRLEAEACRRTVAVSPAGSGTEGAGRSTTVVSVESDLGLKKRSNIEAPLPAFKSRVFGSDGDEGAAARGGDDAT